MPYLARLLLCLCVAAGLFVGSVAHAAERAGNGETDTAIAWLHADGSHEEVPADGDKNVPHHHSICHGHELAAPVKAGAQRLPAKPPVLRPAADAVRLSGPRALPLRPPIA